MQPNPNRAANSPAQGVRTLAVPGAAIAAGAADGSPVTHASCDPAAIWGAPAPLVSAAVLGSTVAVCYGRAAQVLTVNPADGSLVRAGELQYAQQLSALAVRAAARP